MEARAGVQSRLLMVAALLLLLPSARVAVAQVVVYRDVDVCDRIVVEPQSGKTTCYITQNTVLNCDVYAPTPSPTPTFSPSSSATITATRSETATETSTSTVSATVSISFSGTAQPTGSPTGTRSPSGTPSSAPSSSPSPTMPPSLSGTVSASRIPSASPSSSALPPSLSSSLSATLTGTATATATGSATSTNGTLFHRGLLLKPDASPSASPPFPPDPVQPYGSAPVCLLKLSSSAVFVGTGSPNTPPVPAVRVTCYPSPGCEIWLDAPSTALTMMDGATLAASTLNITVANLTVSRGSVVTASGMGPLQGAGAPAWFGNGGSYAGGGGQLPCPAADPTNPSASPFPAPPQRLSLSSVPVSLCCDAVGYYRSSNVSMGSFILPLEDWPAAYGSGGSSSLDNGPNPSAGRGGGRILVTLSEASFTSFLLVDGTLSADGAPPVNANASATVNGGAAVAGVGSGSGGSIVVLSPRDREQGYANIPTAKVLGSGLISANGGNSVAIGSDSGAAVWCGAGGGGHVMLSTANVSTALQLQAYGGGFYAAGSPTAPPAGALSQCFLGSPGTVYISTPGSSALVAPAAQAVDAAGPAVAAGTLTPTATTTASASRSPASPSSSATGTGTPSGTPSNSATTTALPTPSPTMTPAPSTPPSYLPSRYNQLLVAGGFPAGAAGPNGGVSASPSPSPAAGAVAPFVVSPLDVIFFRQGNGDGGNDPYPARCSSSYAALGTDALSVGGGAVVASSVLRLRKVYSSLQAATLLRYSWRDDRILQAALQEEPYQEDAAVQAIAATSKQVEDKEALATAAILDIYSEPTLERRMKRLKSSSLGRRSPLALGNGLGVGSAAAPLGVSVQAQGTLLALQEVTQVLAVAAGAPMLPQLFQGLVARGRTDVSLDIDAAEVTFLDGSTVSAGSAALLVMASNITTYPLASLAHDAIMSLRANNSALLQHTSAPSSPSSLLSRQVFGGPYLPLQAVEIDVFAGKELVVAASASLTANVVTIVGGASAEVRISGQITAALPASTLQQWCDNPATSACSLNVTASSGKNNGGGPGSDPLLLPCDTLAVWPAYSEGESVPQLPNSNYTMVLSAPRVLVVDVTGVLLGNAILACAPRISVQNALNATGMGCPPASGPGKGFKGTLFSGGGAGHGGVGGKSYDNGAGGAAYDSATPSYYHATTPAGLGAGAGPAGFDYPALSLSMGSGGGSAEAAAGGGTAGGGVIALFASGSVVMGETSVVGSDAAYLTNGEAPGASGGGGSGGSILIATTALSGEGALSVRGGDGSQGGGGGAGGRIHLVDWQGEEVQQLSAADSIINSNSSWAAWAHAMRIMYGGEQEEDSKDASSSHGSLELGSGIPAPIAQQFTGPIIVGGGYPGQSGGNYPGSQGGADGTVSSPPCPGGYAGLPICTQCGLGYWRASFSLQTACSPCSNAPERGVYTDPVAASPKCSYVCPAGYLYPLCLTPLEELLDRFGGPVGFAMSMFGIMLLLVILLLCVVRVRRQRMLLELKRASGGGLTMVSSSTGGALMVRRRRKELLYRQMQQWQQRRRSQRCGASCCMAVKAFFCPSTESDLLLAGGPDLAVCPRWLVPCSSCCCGCYGEEDEHLLEGLYYGNDDNNNSSDATAAADASESLLLSAERSAASGNEKASLLPLGKLSASSAGSPGFLRGKGSSSRSVLSHASGKGYRYGTAAPECQGAGAGAGVAGERSTASPGSGLGIPRASNILRNIFFGSSSSISSINTSGGKGSSHAALVSDAQSAASSAASSSVVVDALVANAALQEKDLTRHVARVYLSGTNGWGSPWELPHALPQDALQRLSQATALLQASGEQQSALAHLLDPNRYLAFALRVNSGGLPASASSQKPQPSDKDGPFSGAFSPLSWPRWGLEEALHLLINTFVGTPVGAFFLRWRKRIRVVHLMRAVLLPLPSSTATKLRLSRVETVTSFLHASMLAADVLRLGVSPDHTLAYIDILMPTRSPASNVSLRVSVRSPTPSASPSFGQLTPASPSLSSSSSAAAPASSVAVVVDSSPPVEGRRKRGHKLQRQEGSTHLLPSADASGAEAPSSSPPFPSTFRAPLALLFSGDGSLYSPYHLDPNDTVIKSLPNYLPGLTRFLDNDWLDYVCEINKRTRPITRGCEVQTMGPLLGFLKLTSEAASSAAAKASTAAKADHSSQQQQEEDLLAGIELRLVRFFPSAASASASSDTGALQPQPAGSPMKASSSSSSMGMGMGGVGSPRHGAIRSQGLAAAPPSLQLRAGTQTLKLPTNARARSRTTGSDSSATASASASSGAEKVGSHHPHRLRDDDSGGRARIASPPTATAASSSSSSLPSALPFVLMSLSALSANDSVSIRDSRLGLLVTLKRDLAAGSENTAAGQLPSSGQVQAQVAPADAAGSPAPVALKEKDKDRKEKKLKRKTMAAAELSASIPIPSTAGAASAAFGTADVFGQSVSPRSPALMGAGVSSSSYGARLGENVNVGSSFGEGGGFHQFALGSDGGIYAPSPSVPAQHEAIGIAPPSALSSSLALTSPLPRSPASSLNPSASMSAVPLVRGSSLSAAMMATMSMTTSTNAAAPQEDAGYVDIGVASRYDPLDGGSGEAEKKAKQQRKKKRSKKDEREGKLSTVADEDEGGGYGTQEAPATSALPQTQGSPRPLNASRPSASPQAAVAGAPAALMDAGSSLPSLGPQIVSTVGVKQSKAQRRLAGLLKVRMEAALLALAAATTADDDASADGDSFVVGDRRALTPSASRVAGGSSTGGDDDSDLPRSTPSAGAASAPASGGYQLMMMPSFQEGDNDDDDEGYHSSGERGEQGLSGQGATTGAGEAAAPSGSEAQSSRGRCSALCCCVRGKAGAGAASRSRLATMESDATAESEAPTAVLVSASRAQEGSSNSSGSSSSSSRLAALLQALGDFLSTGAIDVGGSNDALAGQSPLRLSVSHPYACPGAPLDTDELLAAAGTSGRAHNEPIASSSITAAADTLLEEAGFMLFRSAVATVVRSAVAALQQQEEEAMAAAYAAYAASAGAGAPSHPHHLGLSQHGPLGLDGSSSHHHRLSSTDGAAADLEAGDLLAPLPQLLPFPSSSRTRAAMAAPSSSSSFYRGSIANEALMTVGQASSGMGGAGGGSAFGRSGKAGGGGAFDGSRLARRGDPSNHQSLLAMALAFRGNNASRTNAGAPSSLMIPLLAQLLGRRGSTAAVMAAVSQLDPKLLLVATNANTITHGGNNGGSGKASCYPPLRSTSLPSALLKRVLLTAACNSTAIQSILRAALGTLRAMEAEQLQLHQRDGGRFKLGTAASGLSGFNSASFSRGGSNAALANHPSAASARLPVPSSALSLPPGIIPLAREDSISGSSAGGGMGGIGFQFSAAERSGLASPFGMHSMGLGFGGLGKEKSADSLSLGPSYQYRGLLEREATGAYGDSDSEGIAGGRQHGRAEGDPSSAAAAGDNAAAAGSSPLRGFPISSYAPVYPAPIASLWSAGIACCPLASRCAGTVLFPSCCYGRMPRAARRNKRLPLPSPHHEGFDGNEEVEAEEEEGEGVEPSYGETGACAAACCGAALSPSLTGLCDSRSSSVSPSSSFANEFESEDGRMLAPSAAGVLRERDCSAAAFVARLAFLFCRIMRRSTLPRLGGYYHTAADVEGGNILGGGVGGRRRQGGFVSDGADNLLLAAATLEPAAYPAALPGPDRGEDEDEEDEALGGGLSSGAGAGSRGGRGGAGASAKRVSKGLLALKGLGKGAGSSELDLDDDDDDYEGEDDVIVYGEHPCAQWWRRKGPGKWCRKGRRRCANCNGAGGTGAGASIGGSFADRHLSFLHSFPFRYKLVVTAHFVLLLAEAALILLIVSELWCVEPASEAGGSAPNGPLKQQLQLQGYYASGRVDAAGPGGGGGGGGGGGSLPEGETCNYLPISLYFVLPGPGSFAFSCALGLFALASQSARTLRMWMAFNAVTLLSPLVALLMVLLNANVLGVVLAAYPCALFVVKVLSAQCAPVQVAVIESSRPIRGWRGLYEVRSGPVVKTQKAAATMAVKEAASASAGSAMAMPAGDESPSPFPRPY